MTDSSSEMADMAAELVSSKIESARKDTQMTHVLRIGTFHMEIVPDPELDIKGIFNEMIDKLMKKYGEKLLEITVQQSKSEPDGRHYG